MKTYRIILSFCIPAIGAGILVSCGQSREEIERVSQEEVGAPEELDSVHTVLYSRGDAKAVLITPAIERFQYPAKTVFPKGLEIIRYDSLGNVEGTLTANRGFLMEAQGVFEVFDNVILRNLASDQKLMTEHLIWRRKNDSTIVESNELVRIFDGDDVHTSERGARTDDKLSWYEFYGYTYSGKAPEQDSTGL